MVPRTAVPGPFDRLEKTIVERLVGERLVVEPGESASSSFLRGLAMGVLVGAAIAGSAIWERRAAKRRSPSAGGADASAADLPQTASGDSAKRAPDRA